MHYKCDNCRRQFEFDDYIEFCPYCGKSLDGSASGPVPSGSGADLAQAIDSIWGDSARVRKEFSSVISRCIMLINSYADDRIEKMLPKHNLSKYEKNYASIKRSNNRKTLFTRIEGFLNSLDNVIDNLSDRIPADSASRLESAVADTEDAVKELYDFLGMRYVPSNVDFFSEENYSAEIRYTREQLRNLYNLVMAAYSKYRKCVEDNNMFAAFASTSNYGMMTDHWHSWLPKLSSEDEDDENEEKEDSQFEQVVGYMKTHNAEKYFGMLDEDFVPHVDAFWYGLEMLCEFIDHHIAIDCNTECFYINNDERSKILHNISSRGFDVNEARLDSALELKKRFEERVEALNDKK